MKPSIVFSLLALLLLGLVVYSGMNRAALPPTPAAQSATLDLTPTLYVTPTYAPGREPMKLPQNYRENFILYTIVDRPDAITRKIYVTAPAIDAIRKGQDLPERTQILVEAYNAARAIDGTPLHDDQGHLIAGDMQDEIHIAELRSEWQIEDLASSSRLGEWNFDAFEAVTGTPRHEVRFDCFSCHNTAYPTNFIFTQAQMNAYAKTGETQYLYCNQLARQPCTR
jgi:hypothetical protein